MTEQILPPPSAEELAKAQERNHGWSFSKEAAIAFVENARRHGQWYVEDGMNAALRVELPTMIPTLIAGYIEQRAAECARDDTKLKVRMPIRKQVGSRWRTVYVENELPITRELLYHVLLGSKAPALEEITAAPAPHAPVLLDATGERTLRVMRDPDEP